MSASNALIKETLKNKKSLILNIKNFQFSWPQEFSILDGPEKHCFSWLKVSLGETLNINLILFIYDI